MAANTDDGNVINFPRIGFNLTPTTVLDPPPTTPPAPQPDDSPTPARTGRRSPLDTLAALPDPALLHPTVIPAPDAGPQPGHVPDTFRSEPGSDLIGSRLGALSLAAILATAVAALRGTHTVLTTWWENRQARHAETAQLREARLKHQLAMQGIGDKAAQQRAKNNRVPSSSDFGRKTLGGGGGSKSSGRSGTGTSGTGGSGKKPSGPGAGKGLPGAGKKPNTSNTNGSKTPSRKQPPGTSRSDAGGKKPPRPTNPGAGSGKHKNTKSPTNGKQPKPSPTSPALERSRGRQDRADRRQAAKLQRRADRQAARLNAKAEDQDAARKRKNGAQEDRQAAKDKARKDRRNTKQAKKDAAAASDAGRTTLGKAVTKEARRRLKKRRKNLAPPFISKTKKPGEAQDSSTDKTATSEKTRPQNGPKTDPRAKKHKQDREKRQHNGRWAKARAYARKKAAGGDRSSRRTAPGTAGPGPTAGTGPTSSTGGRRSPFENAGQATGPTVWNVERDDYPGAQAKRWEPTQIGPSPAALPPAPTPDTSTTTPPAPPTPPVRDARQETRPMTTPATLNGGLQMDAQHETEITLDDALDDYTEFKDDAFATHDQSTKLADRARKLRDTLATFAIDLATNHNLIGPLFSTAMARMAESMDLVARMADEMKTSSLQAAEMAETADNELNDAYRPYNTATADAGLSTPSAPIHNQS